CRTSTPATDADRDLLGPGSPAQLWHAPGCPDCGHTGYAGRTGIYELMVTDDALQRLIHTAADEAALRAHARAQGTRSLRDDGLRLLADGITSAEELLRVTRD
ncbi:MAG TPA: type II secretion system protein GspE, partial [Rhodocyclaceae bacterium]|nr:type II secretion system protein GspE [Rhodocyclaceae bacterium]